MDIELNKAHFPVTVLGPGRRIGLWLQGCSIGCAGCVSKDTWPADPGRAIAIEVLLRWCREVSGDILDGITISGGEPFEQPAALSALLAALDAWRAEIDADFDLLAYSGLPLRRLQREHRPLLGQLDAVIPEPYVETLPLGQRWRGSSNQPLVALSARGRRRYADVATLFDGVTTGAISDGASPGDPSDGVLPAPDRRLQVSVDAGRIWFIGVPERGEMARVEAACRERGLVFVESSWR